VSILDEVQSEAWYILISIYTHQRIIEAIPKCSTRYDLANQLVSLNALLEIIIIRISRLTDNTKGVRNVSMLLKHQYLSAPVAVKEASDHFILLAKPVVKMRHEQIAHMKPGVLSSYEPQNIPVEAIRATEALISLIDRSHAPAWECSSRRSKN